MISKTSTLRLAGGVAALGLLLTAPGALGGSGDSLTGDATYDQTIDGAHVIAHVQITAHGTGKKEEATGTFRLDQTTDYGGGNVDQTTVTGRITCLAVEGDLAVAGGVVTESNDPREVGRGFSQTVRDEGNGVTSFDESETSAFSKKRPKKKCPDFGVTRFTADAGDFEVVDGGNDHPGKGHS